MFIKLLKQLGMTRKHYRATVIWQSGKTDTFRISRAE